MSLAYIYLVQSKSDGHIGTDIYKIGRTECSINECVKIPRISSYGLGTIVHLIRQVNQNDVNNIEKYIKTYFSTKYKCEKGLEYFKGNIDEMEDDINKIIKKYKKNDKVFLESIVINKNTNDVSVNQSINEVLTNEININQKDDDILEIYIKEKKYAENIDINKKFPIFELYNIFNNYCKEEEIDISAKSYINYNIFAKKIYEINGTNKGKGKYFEVVGNEKKGRKLQIINE